MIPKQYCLAKALMNSPWDHATPGKRVNREDRPRSKLSKSDSFVSDGRVPRLISASTTLLTLGAEKVGTERRSTEKMSTEKMRT